MVYLTFCSNIKKQKQNIGTQEQDRWSIFIQASNLFGIHDSAHSHRQCHGGHLREIPIKESCISHDSVLGQGLHPGPGNKA